MQARVSSTDNRGVVGSSPADEEVLRHSSIGRARKSYFGRQFPRHFLCTSLRGGEEHGYFESFTVNEYHS